ncbi:MAG TPA: response regulator transcription factor [Bryobacteraceae bacterium]|nr:response regulator transcription factor [Bryobacteraceae bacterium]
MWILIAEDELPMANALRRGLEEQNHTVTVANDGTEAIAAANASAFDAIVLDVMMPGADGLTVARRLRQSGNQAPILLLTARDTADDIVKGLDAGADDYLVKPFALKVLLARLRALSRRASAPAAPVLQVDDLILDPTTHQVTRAGRAVNLTATEFRFLEHLMRRAGRVASRTSIIDAVWGFDHDIELGTVDTYIKLLRDKVDTDPAARLIHTVRGYGYVLRDRT